MKNLLKLEELALVVLAAYLFTQLDYAWWWFPLLFFLPDLSMIGYLAGPRVGAWTYNLVHLKALSIVLYFTGLLLGIQILQLMGVIILAHTSFDRVFGYGLKYPDAFTHTHLGTIGKEVRQEGRV